MESIPSRNSDFSNSDHLNCNLPLQFTSEEDHDQIDSTISSDFRRFREGEIESFTNQITALQAEILQKGAMGAGKITANFARYARTMDITRPLFLRFIYISNTQGSIIYLGV